MLNFNARSLKSKLDDFRIILEQSNYFLIGVTETWLNEDVSDSEISSNSSYSIFRRYREGRGGGLLLLISRPYPINVVGEVILYCLNLYVFVLK